MNYGNQINKVILDLENNEKNKIVDLAKTVKSRIDQGGIIYVFGTGHSTILVEEAFHRAGGLVPVYPVLNTMMSPHVTPKIAGPLERLNGVAEILFQQCAPRAQDVFFIVSNSGVNAAAVEMALLCKKNQIFSVAVTSLAHSQSVPAKHNSGKKLYELVDYCLNNHCPPGDALVDFSNIKVGAGSSIANIWIWNTLITEMCALWYASGDKIPVYKSVNLPGGEQQNQQFENQYKDRIPLLR